MQAKIKKIIAITAIALIITAALGAARYFKVKEDTAKAVLGHIETGHAFFLKGNYDSAYGEYLKAWKIKPEITNHDEKNGAVNLAQIMTVKGQDEKAKDIFLKAVKFDPYFYASYLFLGDIYLKEKNSEKALFYLEKGLSLQAHFIKDDPNAALLYYNMAEAQEMKGDKDSAMKNYKIFIDMADKDKRLVAIVAKAKDKIANANK
jgi:tetratricopeptide (TPR) repeat protein